MGDMNLEEQIVMTPTKKGQGHTCIKMERLNTADMNKGSVMHVAGGDHKGIVINKECATDENDHSPPQLTLEFKVFLTNAANNFHTQESRQLQFWFKPAVNEREQMRSAQDFFKELVSPCEFPRDYVGFIKKIMKLMQMNYPDIKKIQVEMKQLEEIFDPPTRPTSVDDSILGSRLELTEGKALEMIENAYPNPLSVADIAKSTQSADEEVHLHLQELLAKGLIKAMDNGMFTRVTQNDTEVKLVRQMPTVVSSQQPTIAIITAQYCEKLAVDAMIENKDTYVKYKTEGESNVYTLGNIGAHRVVATKLPAVGHSRGAIIASGNTTTRLLGTFQKVEYVFLVGVGGGVPHFTDYTKHVRLGDVVVSCPPPGQQQKYIYMYCEKVKNSPDTTTAVPATNGSEYFNNRVWCPPNLELQEIAQKLWEQGKMGPEMRPWEEYIRQGIENLSTPETDFAKPDPETDKLYMSIGGKDVIEVGHPQPADGMKDIRTSGMPVAHFGAVGSGRMVVRDDAVRQEVASRHGIMAFDTEFDAVAESIYGNRKDHYVFIRGIADYKDGTKKREWQPYASLAAAAYMKAIICALYPHDDD